MKLPGTRTLLLFASLTALALVGVVAVWTTTSEGSEFKGCINGKESGALKALEASKFKCFLKPNPGVVIVPDNTVSGSAVR